MKLPELLAPVGNYEKLVTAIEYGADAVYLGGRQFSLRARAGNFAPETLVQAVTYAHEHGVKVYVTVNIFAHNDDLADLPAYLIHLQDAGVDGIIVADPGILRLAQQTVPDLPLHLSTQANTTNAVSAQFWQDQGVSRLNLARELGLEEIVTIREQVKVELEVFVHGALCISYSGRCMLSNYFTGRDANKGDCAHPCRYSYTLMEEKRPGEYFPVEEDERGTYIFNSKDLCLLDHLPLLVGAGVNSLKLEGRMKSMGYVAGVVRVYRAALDWIAEQDGQGVAFADMVMPDLFSQEIAKVGTRGQTKNFFQHRPVAKDMLYDTMRVDQTFAPAAVIRGLEPLLVEARNVLECGDELEYMGKEIQPYKVSITQMQTEKGEAVTRANPGNRVLLQTDPALPTVMQCYHILRKNMQPKGEM